MLLCAFVTIKENKSDLCIHIFNKLLLHTWLDPSYMTPFKMGTNKFKALRLILVNFIIHLVIL